MPQTRKNPQPFKAAGTTWDVVNDPNGHTRYEALLVAFEPEWVQSLSGLDWPRTLHTISHARMQHTGPTLLEAVQRTLDQSASGPVRRHRMQEVLLLLALGLFASVHAHAFEVQSPSLKPDLLLTQAHAFAGFGCEGGNQSPALTWTQPPEGTQSLAITVHDPDAPTGSGWWHWVVYNW